MNIEILKTIMLHQLEQVLIFYLYYSSSYNFFLNERQVKMNQTENNKQEHDSLVSSLHLKISHI